MREDRYKKLAVCLLIGIVFAVDYCSGQIDTQSEEKYVFDSPSPSRRNVVSSSRLSSKRETTSRILPPPRGPQEPEVPSVCYASQTYPGQTRSQNNIVNVARSVLQLANNIGNSLYYTRAVKTQVFSPLSIAGALALVLMGANRETYSDIMSVFGYNRAELLARPSLIHAEFGTLIQELVTNQIRRPISPWKCQKLPEELRPDNSLFSGPPEEYHQVSVANGIFVQSDFSLNRDYKAAVESVYGGEIKRLDFTNPGSGAVRYINDWVEQKTNGKIRNILGNGVSGNARMIIASALYFKGLWERSFIQGGTSVKNFYPDGESEQPIQVEMMANGGVFPFYNSEKYDCRILGLPYKGNLSTMYIILPNNSTRQKLRMLQRELTADAIEEMIANMRMKTAVMIFPKMHIESSFNLKEILTGLGVRTLFDPVLSDLSLMSGGVGGIRQPVQEAVQFPQPAGLEEPVDLRPNIQQRNSFVIPEHYNYLQNLRRGKRAVKYKVESSFRRNPEPLRLKDFIIGKRITKLNPDKKSIRHRRQVSTKSVAPGLQSLYNLEEQRRTIKLANPGLFAENIVHKVDLTVNEKGTEGGAATVVYLTRSGTDVIFRVDTPFMFLIRHEPTKLPIFYGSVFEPVNN